MGGLNQCAGIEVLMDRLTQLQRLAELNRDLAETDVAPETASFLRNLAEKYRREAEMLACSRSADPGGHQEN